MEKYCQSCGMPLEKDVCGPNKDGSLNEKYCKYCFKDGTFTSDMSMEEMIAFCVPIMVKEVPDLTAEEAKKQMEAYFPQLERWR